MKHTMKVYKNSDDYAAYAKARFNKENSERSFEYAGHRWAYDFTGFDDNGDYDLLFRFDDQPYPEQLSGASDDMSLRDYFAAKFMQGICANSARLYGKNDLAKESYDMADAMLKARNS